jgi:lipopolysaccharide/colanic/teichoic acid biosynthesis glycosyltransferase
MRYAARAAFDFGPRRTCEIGPTYLSFRTAAVRKGSVSSMNAYDHSRPLARSKRAFAVLPPLARLRFQLPIVIIAGAFVPALIVGERLFYNPLALSATSNAFFAALVSSLVSLIFFRRLGTFPGITSLGQVAPAVLGPYVVAVLLILFARLDYSRPLLSISACLTTVVLFSLWRYRRNRCAPSIYSLPGTNIDAGRVTVRPADLTMPLEHLDRNPILVADLRRDLPAEWQEYLLRAALSGIPVYHAKQLQESLLGRVEVEHLSENTFGSLNPDQIYAKAKRLFDLGVSIVLLPPLAVAFAAIAVAISLESSGGVFFTQWRMGRRGEPFRVIKFRSMYADADSSACRERAKTQDHDPRITRVGAILRRYRLDELPQVFNILRGEMSWIGPRPEALELSSWYREEIPFYGYRHMVRPGITGWAQVHQGHVHDLASVTEKLQYDFYYIKHFSWWLDALIVLRTLRTVIVGNGAR